MGGEKNNKNWYSTTLMGNLLTVDKLQKLLGAEKKKKAESKKKTVMIKDFAFLFDKKFFVSFYLRYYFCLSCCAFTKKKN